MAGFKIKLDSAGMEEMLKSAGVASAVTSAASSIAASADTTLSSGEVMPIEAEADEPTDRARATVIVKHPAAVGAEAKYGVLTKAAAAAGYEVRSRKKAA